MLRVFLPTTLALSHPFFVAGSCCACSGRSGCSSPFSAADSISSATSRSKKLPSPRARVSTGLLVPWPSAIDEYMALDPGGRGTVLQVMCLTASAVS
ncbi:hypothetical protein K437DRAFT_42424 [Tilletiaria anomala UBC 951]|uniref:Secreted protein n=1 Tax=Tilletiaria anomala (strain ATCC 24038 / CBS 436.72 / UBC 951) TaxID=1037660 RepID=A0A066VF66_TILAU|nr:uncharacterized protein K437DRAFT_42424 [Tilletiaria anomala UBC 951]KDN37240.1 hypothetical protein K437DRAFT_42424 [Tilletiaria anomala UBC 951]